tara:strand:+ start:405 stop:572 length:168 start_codon:yes stop_codon:yes gene_type:complete
MRAVWVTLGASGVNVLNGAFGQHNDGGKSWRENGTVERGRFHASRFDDMEETNAT